MVEDDEESEPKAKVYSIAYYRFYFWNKPAKPNRDELIRRALAKQRQNKRKPNEFEG